MMNEKDRRDIRSMLFLALLAVSFLLFSGSIYLIKNFAIIWGSGAGAILQTSTDKAQIINILQPVVSNLSLFHIAIVISYLLSVVSLVLASSALILCLRRNEEETISVRTYGLIHSTFMIFYLLILFVLHSELGSYLQTGYLFVVYAGLLLGIAVDAYVQYDIRKYPSPRQSQFLGVQDINMDPTKPYTNMLNLQHEMLSKMSGQLGVVDKHFNTSSLENFHRLIEKYVANFDKITILTSKEMLDSNFSASVMEFNKEMESSGINAEVRIMDPKDSADQHERFLMDDSTAYKIPPLNIINKKSEHITKIKLSEAKSRFNYLYGRASKIDNYLVRKGHEEQRKN